MLEACVVCWRHVQCVGGMCSVLEACVVCWRHV